MPYTSTSFEVGSNCKDASGGVWSMFTTHVIEAEFPALSVASPVTVCLAPCPVSVTEGETDATPDTRSVAPKLTVTGVLFQPLALGSGERLHAISGGVWSIMIWMVFAASTLPATSVER